MLYLFAILLPPVAFLFAGKPFQAILSILLMCTVIGWIPAAIWAIAVVADVKAQKRQKQLIKALKR
jgi:uncharacterized membrane protein YqaE (UPF0057 family)